MNHSSISQTLALQIIMFCCICTQYASLQILSNILKQDQKYVKNVLNTEVLSCLPELLQYRGWTKIVTVSINKNVVGYIPWVYSFSITRAKSIVLLYLVA